MTDLLLTNATVLTMDPSLPCASALAVRDSRIIAVGDEAEVRSALGRHPERVDCGGGTLLPAFIDGHCHLLAYAAALQAVDCTGARSIAAIRALVRERAERTDAGGWIRAFGYEETLLAERRHPNRRDLDGATSDHPVRLVHRSGHASVLNSTALAIAGITIESEEPPGGVIERDHSTGEPNGVLLDMEERMNCAMPRPSYDELRDSTRDASERMLRQGITCIVDASHTNGRERWDLFEHLIADGAIAQDVTLMEGFAHLGELPEIGASGRLRQGAVKIMLHELGDELSPDEGELSRQVREVHRAGRQVAIHAAGWLGVAAAVDAIESALDAEPRADHRHRIEHCGVLPDGMAARMATAGIVVVSQPAFLRERGERYLQLVPEAEQSRLYAFRSLVDAGVTLAASSDAPVTQPEPLASVASAVERTGGAGRAIGPEERVDALSALDWWTAGAARSTFLEGQRGVIASGVRADVVLLDRDPTACPSHELGSIEVEQVWIGGQARLET